MIRQQISLACSNVRRNPQDVRVIAVTKTVDESALEPLLHVGLRDFGENRWQQAKGKLEHPLASRAIWHFIGHLQMNKVKYIAPRFAWVHSVDSLELAQELGRLTGAQAIRILLQVNVSGEQSKSGLHPDDVFQVVNGILPIPGVVLSGLMTMAPQTDDLESTRPVFRALRTLRDEVESHFHIQLPELSMGMSNDYAIAVEEGATMVRIGRKLLDPS